MHSRTVLGVLPLLLALVKTQEEVTPGSAHSNVKENFLYSCLELECPVEDTSRQTFCKLANQTLLAVGMAEINAEEVAPGANFTWTVGHNQYMIEDESNAGAMNIERVYYMGKQFDDEDDTHGCAFYMVKERNNENVFPRPAKDFFAQKAPSMCRTNYLQGKDPENNPGSCAKALDEIFQNSTANVANTFRNATSSFPQSACQQIADDAWNVMRSTTKLNNTGCSIAFDGPEKAIIRGHPVTGEYAEEPIPTAENADRACYPTLPKTNELTRVFSYNISVNKFGSQTLRNAFDGETPVWTAFWKENATEEATDDAAKIKTEDVWLDMVCLRSLNMNKALDEAMSNGTPNGALSMVGDVGQLRAAMGVVLALVAGSYLL